MSLSGLFSSKTILGTLLAVIGFLAQPSVLAILPTKVAAIVGALGALLAAIGLRSAIATNGVASTPSTAAKANGTG